MSQWSGSFSVYNQTGSTIYNGSVSHTAAGCQGQTAITIPSSGLANGATLPGGVWQTETTSRDFWSYNYHSSSPNGQYVHRTSKQCSLYTSDSSVLITLNPGGAIIAPNHSSSCSTSNSD
ncbi:MAG TPA: hypothetical protein VGE98_03400 [Thermoanaerobaculia bacterium]